jgi:hypothetical protein
MSSTCETQFSQTITGFVELFTDIISTAHKNNYTTLNSEMLKIANMMLSKKLTDLGPINVMNNFISNTHKHWNYIAEKDEKHFAEHLPEIIKDIPKDYIKEFCKLFLGTTKSGKPMISDVDKEAFFESGAELVKISIKYIYKSRKPKMVDGKISYEVNFFPDISLTKNAKLFNVKLN